MTYKINGKSIKLNRAEVKISRRILAKYLKRIEGSAKERHLPTFFFTFLNVAHVMTQEALDNMDPENLAMIMNTLNK